MATSRSKPQTPTADAPKADVAAPKDVDGPAAAAVKETAPAEAVDSKPDKAAKHAKPVTYRDAAVDYAAAILELTEGVVAAVEDAQEKRRALHDLAPTYEDSRLHMHAARLDSALRDLLDANAGVRAMGADLAAS